MGWFWGSSSPAGDDTFDSLDPKLQGYLNEQSAAQQQRQQTPASSLRPSGRPPYSPSQEITSYSAQLGLADSLPRPSHPATTESPASDQSTVPPQSLYPDGRYADLWSTYRSPNSTASSASSQDQLTSLLSTYQSRRAEISRAAIENCVEEHLAENDCFTSGSLAKKMGNCREESRNFSRCYTLQARMLRGMGYMDVDLGAAAARRGGAGDLGQDELRERMQMRADEVWNEIRRREIETEKAKEEGLAEPEFEPLADFRGGGVWIKRNLTPAQAEAESQKKTREQREETMMGRFSPARREVLREMLAKMSPPERELELKLQLAEQEAHAGYGDKIDQYHKQEVEDRRARKEQGKSTPGDFLKWLGGWSQ